MPASVRRAGALALPLTLSIATHGEVITGNAPVDRPADDVAPGGVRLLADIVAEGRVLAWGVYDNEEHPVNRALTPVIVEIVGGTVVIVGIGTPRVTNESGAQEWGFGRIAGDDLITADRRFGWFNGTPSSDNAGVIDSGPLDTGDVDAFGVAASFADIALGVDLGAPVRLGRAYSVAFNVRPDLIENCAPPVDPERDRESFPVVRQTPPWTEAQFGTYVDEKGEERPYKVRYHVPDDPVGLVYFFHGGGGGATVSERLDVADVLNRLIEDGFAFVATDSTDRVANVWDIHPDTFEGPEPHVNADHDRLVALRDELLVPETALTGKEPLFAFGFSNGSKMSFTFALLLARAGEDIRAIAAYNPAVSPVWDELAVGAVRVPAFIVLQENDFSAPPCGAMRVHEKLLDDRIITTLHAGREKAIAPLRFNRIPEVFDDSPDGTLARAIFDFFVAGGVIDEDGARILDCTIMDEQLRTVSAMLPEEVFPPGWSNNTKSSVEREARRQVEIAWAEHALSSEFREQQADFFQHALHPADVALDGAVDLDDLLVILSRWGPCEEQPCWADVDRDGAVGLSDLLVVLSRWGRGGAP